MNDNLAAEAAAEIAAIEKEIGQGNTQELQAQTPEPVEEPQEPHEPEDGEPQRQNPGAFVRKRDLLTVKERAEAAEARAKELEARYAEHASRSQARLDMLERIYTQQRQEPKPEPQVQIPDINADPIGHFQAQIAARDKRIEEMESWRKGQQEQTEQTDKIGRIRSEVNRLEAEFASKTPDYQAAQQHLFKTWEAEAAVAGVSPQEAIQARTWEIVQLAGRSGKNPAQLAYDLAKARGYAQQTQANGNIAQPAQRTGPTIETLQKGVAASRSTGAAPGSAAGGVPTLQALQQMDDDEFIAKYVGAGKDKEWAKVMRPLTSRPI